MVKNIHTKYKLCILNDTCPTYVKPATGSSSAIDLSVCSVNILWTCSGKHLKDVCGIDHYPIAISYGSTETSSEIPSWKLHTAYWQSFSHEAREQLVCSNPDISLDECSEMIIAIAYNNVPKSNFFRQKAQHSKV